MNAHTPSGDRLVEWAELVDEDVPDDLDEDGRRRR
ncbi:hypothetical protein J2751_001206 [Halorubrum alkaliphilum]|uniref:Uncharacterized protein n=1 Tax=Halorubrum alkaliphilum TaxID=261290 RepID=A0A8T4GEW7_9EURY|nr:hypothetical protein [Halorubrum alkaliphilum]